MRFDAPAWTTHDPTIGRSRNLPLEHVQKLEPPRNHDLVASLALISLKRPARSKSQMLSAVAMRAMEITKSSSLLRLARLIPSVWFDRKNTSKGVTSHTHTILSSIIDAEFHKQKLEGSLFYSNSCSNMEQHGTSRWLQDFPIQHI